MDFEQLKAWQGNTEQASERVDPARVAQLAGALGREVDTEPGSILPALWHWILFQPVVAASATGADGHPARGGFLPPVELPRRMWAGSQLEYFTPLKLGEEAHRLSTVESVTPKQGRQGPLVFVRVRHDISNGRGELALREQQDIVYRELPGKATPTLTPYQPERPAAWECKIVPDPVLLFRYSALTFNAHRIHYDRNWATEEEGYPGLVVHGPLIATLLAELAALQLPEVGFARLQFRGVSPLFDIRPFTLQGVSEEDGVELWALNSEGALAMSMSIKLEDKHAN